MRRSVASSGLLKRLVEEDGVTGAIIAFDRIDRAVRGTDEYDEEIFRLKSGGTSIEDIALSILSTDSKLASDCLLGVYESSGKRDGIVTVPLPPVFLNDLEKAVEGAKRLLVLIDRPNISIRLPATAQGIAAAEELTYAGINVSLTDVFSVSRYQVAAFSYVKGLERRARSGRPVDSVFGSVSFHLSPIDVATSFLIDEALKRITSHDAAAILRNLSWKVALFAARLVYLKHEDVFGGMTFREAEKSGARPQVIVWEETAPRAAHLDPLMYAEGLSGGNTITAFSLETLFAFREGRAARAGRGGVGGIGGRQTDRVKEGLAEAHRAIKELEDLGLSLDSVASRLEEESAKKGMESYEALLNTVSERAGELSRKAGVQAPSGAALEGASLEAARLLMEKDFPAKLWAKDPALWIKPGDEAGRRIVRGALGWLSSPAMMEDLQGGLRSFSEEVRKAGLTECVLLGMGGSSLAPLVLSETFGAGKPREALTVLDTTDPEAVLSVVKERSDVMGKLFIVSSKSGSTIEPLSLFEYFYSLLKELKGEKAGENFVAITDPGTALEGFSRKYSFRRTFLNWKDIGGRFSALSYFGLVPAALIGVDVEKLLCHALSMRAAIEPSVAPLKNPALSLGALLAGHYAAGRDKVTFFLSKEIASFGLWIEQLMAESTGKEGKGLVPITGELPGKPSEYSNDRVFVQISLKETDEAASKKLNALSKAGHPVLRFMLKDPYELGGEFLRWEAAIAAAGAAIGINPFDQPDVELSKMIAMERLGKREGEEGGRAKGAPRAPHEREVFPGKHLTAHFGKKTFLMMSAHLKEKASVKEALSLFLGLVRERDYVAVLPYFNPMDKKANEAFGKIRKLVRERTGAPVQFGWGPRYLHSTGQLHKGGADNGVFLLFAHGPIKDAPVPGSHFTFSDLERSQAYGDTVALDSKGRRVVIVDLQDPGAQATKEALHLFE